MPFSQSCLHANQSGYWDKWPLLRLYTNPERILSSVLLLLLNPSSTLDALTYQILISTLGDWGVRIHTPTYFLSLRWDVSVAWSGSDSSPHSLTARVPQGSVLCPLLFFLYIKSPGSLIRSHGLFDQLYADETQLHFSFPSSTSHDSQKTSDICLSDISGWRPIIRSLSLTKLI